MSTAVTPTLFLGTDAPLVPATRVTDPDTALEVIRNGGTVLVADRSIAHDCLVGLGFSADDAAARLDTALAGGPTHDEVKALPRDGDGDGMIEDGTPRERPALIQPISALDVHRGSTPDTLDGMSENEGPTTYLIPAVNLPGLQAKFGKLARKADRLGVPAPTLTVLDRVERDEFGEFGEKTGRIEVLYNVSVTGESPHYDGWHFVAVIEMDHDEPDSPNMVSTLPDAPEGSVDPEWRTMSERCDHCGVANRRRNKLVVVENDNGERKIVGSTCLQDFLGGQSPSAIASWATVLAELDSEIRDEFMGGGGEYRYDPVTYLGWVVRDIQENGWISRSFARSADKIATADSALHEMDLASGRARPLRGETRPEPLTDDEVSKAAAAWEWASTQGGNDYLDNLNTVAQKTTLRAKHLGLAASIISGYDRAQSREIERAAQAQATAASTHVGNVGDRVEITGTVTFVKFFDGDYGTRALVKILADGNVLTWWCSNASNAPEQGDVVTGKATIKAHETYQDIAQTVITRARLDVVPPTDGVA